MNSSGLAAADPAASVLLLGGATALLGAHACESQRKDIEEHFQFILFPLVQLDVSVSVSPGKLLLHMRWC